MAIPHSRDTLIEYAYKSLGKPVIDINVDYEQAEDRLDSQTELDSQNRRRKNGTVKSTYWTVAWGII